jgi:hypothetical protein
VSVTTATFTRDQAWSPRPASTTFAELLDRFGDPLLLWTCVHHNGAPAIRRTLACPDQRLQTASQLAQALALPLGLTQLDAEGALWTQQIYQAFISAFKEKPIEPC